jgi:hypothetical protein
MNLASLATVTNGHNLVIADRHGLGIRMLGLAGENFAVKKHNFVRGLCGRCTLKAKTKQERNDPPRQ